jgi:hypothetical protein
MCRATWGTGKLCFEAMKIKSIRIYNRPAYNSKVQLRVTWASTG